MKMDHMSPRKSHHRRNSDPVDDWLYEQGYYRKAAPRDPTCLFRAFSDKIYTSQNFHIRVRKECVDFMRKNKELFQKSVALDLYLEQMSCLTEWGGMNEIQAMSLLYKVEVIIFNGQKETRHTVTRNGFKDKILLLHTMQRQYDVLYKRDYIAVAGFCQSLVYNMLYKDVFKIDKVDDVVNKMLHDRPSYYQGRNERGPFPMDFMDRRDQREGDDSRLPFTYRVAKALDQTIYRNVDIDTWHEVRREVRGSGYLRYNNNELQVGGRCLILVEEESNDDVSSTTPDCHDNDNRRNSNKGAAKREPLYYHGHVQEMSKDQGPVVVFIEEIGEKRLVPYSRLKVDAYKKPLRQSPTPMHHTRCRNSAGRAIHYEPRLYPDQKWPRNQVHNASQRKPKNPPNSLALVNSSDRNNNYMRNRGRDDNSWNRVESSSDSHCQPPAILYNSYTMENFTACDTTVTAMPASVIYQQPPPPIQTPTQPDTTVDINRNTIVTPTTAKPPQKEEQQQVDEKKKMASNAEVESSPRKPIYNAQNESYLMPPPPPGMAPMYPVQPNVMCPIPEGVQYPMVPYVYGNQPDLMQLDPTIRSVNFHAAKSIDIHGLDLPFSDVYTLRFFYNLGLEYYRSSQAWTYPSNSVIPPPPQGNPNNMQMYAVEIKPPEMNPNMGYFVEGEAQENRSKEYTPRYKRDNNNDRFVREKFNSPSPCKSPAARNQDGNVKKNDYQRALMDSPKTPVAGERNNEEAAMSLLNPPQNQDQRPANGKNLNVAPRFRKNTMPRPRNYEQSPQQLPPKDHQGKQQQRYQYQPRVCNAPNSERKSPMVMQQQQKPEMSPNCNQAANKNPQQMLHPPTAPSPTHNQQMNPNQPPPSGPIYSNEIEAMQQVFPGHPINYYTMPYVQSLESGELGPNNPPPYPAGMYPGMENYSTPYPVVYPYLVQPPPLYSNSQAPPNVQEAWYPPVQPQFVQYAQLPTPPVAGNTNNAQNPQNNP